MDSRDKVFPLHKNYQDLKDVWLVKKHSAALSMMMQMP